MIWESRIQSLDWRLIEQLRVRKWRWFQSDFTVQYKHVAVDLEAIEERLNQPIESIRKSIESEERAIVDLEWLTQIEIEAIRRVGSIVECNH